MFSCCAGLYSFTVNITAQSLKGVYLSMKQYDFCAAWFFFSTCSFFQPLIFCVNVLETWTKNKALNLVRGPFIFAKKCTPTYWLYLSKAVFFLGNKAIIRDYERCKKIPWKQLHQSGKMFYICHSYFLKCYIMNVISMQVTYINILPSK